MPPSAEYMNLPFEEAIEFFRRKVNLPTRTWRDLWQGMHSRAFVVAGAMKTELLADLRAAVDKAISKGTTLEEFRKDFDQIVQRHGWQYRGKRGWRTAVIFNTNLSTAYAAGHWQQMNDPLVRKLRPYLRYVASSSAEPREEHMAWYNIVLPYDHEFWKTHTPPNGWGCKCGIVSHSRREVERLKKETAESEFPISEKPPRKQYYEWTNKDTGEVYRVPKGIDPGWDYNPGEAAWGRKLSREAMKSWKMQGAKAWERLTPGDWETYGRPERIRVDKPKARVGPTLRSTAALKNSLEKALGGSEKVFSFQQGQFRYDILANAETISEHVPLDRSPFVPFIREALEEPFEVWLQFERHKGTGRYELRQRVIKAVRLDKDRAILMVVQSRAGMMEAWTMIPTSDLAYVNNQRQGKLIWSR